MQAAHCRETAGSLEPRPPRRLDQEGAQATCRNGTKAVQTAPPPPGPAHLDVVDAEALQDGGREHAAGKGAAEYGLELRVQAADAEGLEAEGAGLEQLVGGEALLARHLDGGLAWSRGWE